VHTVVNLDRRVDAQRDVDLALLTGACGDDQHRALYGTICLPRIKPRVVWDVGVGTEFAGPGDRSRFFGVTGFSFGF
jgi:hypothetical protein